MKKPLLLAFAFIFSITLVRGQIADGTVLQNNIVITDMDGNQWDVFAMLDEGKTVVLDLFAEWCGPCWSYHNTHALADLYDQYGPEGTDELMVIAVETDPSTPATVLTGGAGSSYGWDWTAGTPYPLADQNIGNIFEQAYYPYIIKICPNRQIFEVGQSSAASIYQSVGTCFGPASGEYNPAVVAYTGDITTCDQVSVSVDFQNLGSETLTEASFEVSAGGSVQASVDWTGTLQPYEISQLSIGTVSLTESEDIVITSNVSGQEANTFLQPIQFGMPTTTEITLSLTLDTYPDETKWRVYNASGSVVSSGGPYPSSMANTLVTKILNLADGCYKFRIYDEYGDGLNAGYWGGTDGFYELKDSDDLIIASGGGNVQFTMEETAFVAGGITGLDNAVLSDSFTLFPNPTKGKLTLRFDTKEAIGLTFQVRDILGRAVVSGDFGTVPQGRFDYTLDLSHLNPGLYLVTLTSGDTQMVKKITLAD